MWYEFLYAFVEEALNGFLETVLVDYTNNKFNQYKTSNKNQTSKK